MSCADSSAGAGADAGAASRAAASHHYGHADGPHRQYACRAGEQHDVALRSSGLCAGGSRGCSNGVDEGPHRRIAGCQGERHDGPCKLRRTHTRSCRKDYAARLPHRYDRRLGLIRILHFEKLTPLCPVCRAAGVESLIEIRQVLKQDGDIIKEALLACKNSSCLSEYPVIDGIPVIVPNLRSYISQNVLPVLGRDDLSDRMESLLGDCCGPGSAFDARRQYLSTYAYDHYGDLDDEKSRHPSAPPGSIVKLLRRGASSPAERPGGPVIDLGCAVGRAAFELAAMTGETVLGVDLNFAMLKTAAKILATGNVSYPLRRGGLVFQRRSFSVEFQQAALCDFWVCDASALPFPDQAFSMAASLNVLDCVSSPYEHLKEIARILMPQAPAVLSTPYDWSANATPVEAWLGGHSQRSEHQGASPAVVRSLLAGGGHSNAISNLKLITEEDFPWTLRLHDRSFVEYLVHLMVMQRT